MTLFQQELLILHGLALHPQALEFGFLANLFLLSVISLYQIYFLLTPSSPLEKYLFLSPTLNLPLLNGRIFLRASQCLITST